MLLKKWQQKLNIWPLLKANHFDGRSLIFLSWVIGRIIRLLLNLRNYLLIENPFALQHVANTLQTIIQQWDCEFDIPIQRFIQAKKAWFYCTDWLGNHLRNTGSAHGKSISTKPTWIQAWIFWNLAQFFPYSDFFSHRLPNFLGGRPLSS